MVDDEAHEKKRNSFENKRKVKANLTNVFYFILVMCVGMSDFLSEMVNDLFFKYAHDIQCSSNYVNNPGCFACISDGLCD